MAGFITNALLLPLAPSLLHAQASGDGFLFGQPRFSFSVRGGLAKPIAGSGVFDDASKFLTVSKGDFTGVSFASDLSVRITQRFDATFSTGLMTRRVDSQFRDWVDLDDRPIEQYTSFRRVPFTAGLKYRLASPGRSLGRLAWIPAKWSPYIGAGGGMMYYSFTQEGDFVDFQSLDVFPDRLESRSFAPTGYAHAGFDYSLTPRFTLVSDARYDFGRAKMNTGDFEGYDDIDLSGVSFNVGFGIRF